MKLFFKWSNVFELILSVWNRICGNICNHRWDSISTWSRTQGLHDWLSLRTWAKAELWSWFLVNERFIICSWAWYVQLLLSSVSPFDGKWRLTFISLSKVRLVICGAWSALLLLCVSSNGCSISELDAHAPLIALDSLRWNVVGLHWWWDNLSYNQASALAWAEAPFWQCFRCCLVIWIVRIHWWEIASSTIYVVTVISCGSSYFPRWLTILCGFKIWIISSWSWNFACTWLFKLRA